MPEYGKYETTCKVAPRFTEVDVRGRDVYTFVEIKGPYNSVLKLWNNKIGTLDKGKNVISEFGVKIGKVAK